MTRQAHIAALRVRIGGFGRQESGASLVEFGIVILVFLFLIFAIIDMGRLAHAWTSAQKATQLAARLASVRPPVCTGVPERNVRPAGTTAAATTYGTLCRAGTNICALPATSTCTGSAAHPTAAEIFAKIRPLLPATAVGGAPVTAANLRFSYAADPDLGFLGGPYVPMVSVELVGLEFDFVTNLDLLIAPVTGRSGGLGGNIELPSMSVSVPGEDLALGTAG